jgi:CRP-like cAMP-binding protein
MIASTSFLSFIATRDDGTQARQYAQILALLRTIPSVSLSRTDIANLTGIRLASVCGRVAELRDDGLVIEPATRKCPTSGRMVKVVQAAPDLFMEAA